MAFIRAVLFYLTIFSGMIILGTPYIIYKGTFCRRKNEITNVCSFYFKYVVFRLFGIKVKVEGAENIPKDRGFVIVANHMSFLDIPVFWPSIGNAAFVAKAALWKAPVFGWVLDSIGCTLTTITTSSFSPKDTAAPTVNCFRSRTAFSRWPRKTGCL